MSMSTAEEVALLEATFHPQPGDVILWEAMEETLALKRTVARFRSIYRAWQRYHLRTHNRWLKPLSGVGMQMLVEYQRVGVVRTEFHGVCTSLGRVHAHADAVQVGELTIPQRAEAEHVQRMARRLHQALQEEARKLQRIPRTPLPAAAPSPRPALVRA